MFSRSNFLSVTTIVLLLIAAMVGIAIFTSQAGKSDDANNSVELKAVDHDAANPLTGKIFHLDSTREITKLAEQYRLNGNISDADLADKIAKQPGTTWLVGPSESDPTAQHDIDEVIRTSTDALAQKSVPIYVLYAIPLRDACASFSKGGFTTAAQYKTWLQAVMAALQTKAVLIIEPDALAHSEERPCFTDQQREERYRIIRDTVYLLAADSNVLATYIDVGNSEWKPNPRDLVEPLKKSGIDKARGISVNLASFVPTSKTVVWSERLVRLLGNNKGVIIDTSRNGKGAPDDTVIGTARWCNPKGRGLGHVPTTDVDNPIVDAYIWGKKIGESDGECFGNPPAGVFVPSLALELARNATL